MSSAREQLFAVSCVLTLSLVAGACGGEARPQRDTSASDESAVSKPSDEDEEDEEGASDDADDDTKSEEEGDAKRDAGGVGAGSTKDSGRSSKPDAMKSDGGTASADGGGSSNTAPVTRPPVASGPADGKDGAPVVAIPEAKCGSASGLDGFVGANFGGFPVPGTPNIKIGGRDVVLTYPCNKREGAHVTFILNLHGTMPDEGLKLYQHSYFAAHKLAESHNLIVVSPKSVVSQWGNGDGGKDLPHLYEVIDWVYEKFSKFEIVGLWVGGHSWGSMYAKNFVCDEKLRERARGIIGMSGGATGVGAGGFGGALGGGGGGDCAARLSQIHTVGDAEGGEAGVPDQTAAATKHGCKARSAPRDIGKGQMLYDWPECDPGWVHFNFVMGAHEHITPINDEVVKHIVEQIKATETAR